MDNQALLRQLSDEATQQSAVQTLLQRLQDGDFTALGMARSGIIAAVVGILQSSSIDTAVDAIRCLDEFAQADIKFTISQGVLDPVVQCLSSKAARIQQAACTALTVLVTGLAAEKVDTLAVTAGALNPLASLLKAKSAPTRAAAVKALGAFRIESYEAIAQALRSAGVLKHLAELIDSTDPEVHLPAIKLTWQLLHDKGPVGQSVKTTIARAIVPHLFSSFPRVSEEASLCAANLSIADDQCCHALAQAGAIKHLSRLLDGPSKGAAAFALANLAGKGHAKAVVQEGAIPQLVQILREANGNAANAKSQAQQDQPQPAPTTTQSIAHPGLHADAAAARCLANLAHGPSHHAALQSAGALEQLVLLLTSSTPKAAEYAASALCNILNDSPHLAQTLLAAGAAEPLALLLRSPDSGEATAAAVVLARLLPSSEQAGHQQGQQRVAAAVLAADAVGAAVRLLNAATEEKVQMHLLTVIAVSLSDFKTSTEAAPSTPSSSSSSSSKPSWATAAAAILAADGEQLFARLLQQHRSSSSDPTLQLLIADVLRILAQDPEGAKKVAHSGAATYLVYLLKAPKRGGEKPALLLRTVVNALLLLCRHCSGMMVRAHAVAKLSQLMCSGAYDSYTTAALLMLALLQSGSSSAAAAAFVEAASEGGSQLVEVLSRQLQQETECLRAATLLAPLAAAPALRAAIAAAPGAVTWLLYMLKPDQPQQEKAAAVEVLRHLAAERKTALLIVAARAVRKGERWIIRSCLESQPQQIAAAVAERARVELARRAALAAGEGEAAAAAVAAGEAAAVAGAQMAVAEAVANGSAAAAVAAGAAVDDQGVVKAANGVGDEQRDVVELLAGMLAGGDVSAELQSAVLALMSALQQQPEMVVLRWQAAVPVLERLSSSSAAAAAVLGELGKEPEEQQQVLAMLAGGEQVEALPEAAAAAPAAAGGGVAAGDGCAQCGAAQCASGKALQRCVKCREARYCSKECQKAHWPAHKQRCKQLTQGR